jgi:hypothetical protein
MIPRTHIRAGAVGAALSGSTATRQLWRIAIVSEPGIFLVPNIPTFHAPSLSAGRGNLVQTKLIYPLFSFAPTNVSVAGPSCLTWVENLISRASNSCLAEALEAYAKDCLTRTRRASYLVPLPSSTKLCTLELLYRLL